MTKNQLESMSHRPAGVDYEAYKALCKAAGADAMDEDEYDAMDEKDDDSEEMEKGFSAAGLTKALAAYQVLEQGLAGGDTRTSRETLLKSRVAAGTITPDEQRELAALWSGGGGDERREPIQKSLLEDLRDRDPEAGDLVDASEILKSMGEGIEARLGSVSATVAAGNRAAMELLKAQGQVLAETGKALVKSLGVIQRLNDRLDRVERTPGQPRAVNPKAPARPRDMSKGGVGSGGSEPQPLTKARQLDGIRELTRQAFEKDDKGSIDMLERAAGLIEIGSPCPPQVAKALETLYAGQ